MNFSFIHTADWQIGKPFRNFPERLAGRLEEARLDAIDRLAEAAQARGIRHVLVAGDIWDSDRLSSREERQPLVRMGKHADVTWVLIPGNHDAARAGSVWSRLANLGAPANVVALVEPRPAEIAPGVVVLPAPLISRRPGSDPTAWMDHAETGAGTRRIGLAHGSVQGFGSDDGSEGIIDAARAKRAGLEYLALGDWHGAIRINARTWYSGTPEPDRFKDNEPGEALAVTLGPAGADPVVERIATGRFAWVDDEVDVATIQDLDRFATTIRRRGVVLDRIMLKLRLKGRLSLVDLIAVEAWRDRFAAELQYLDCDTRSLGLVAGLDLDVFGTSGELRTAATTLTALASAPDEPRAADASEALRQLLSILAEVRDGPQAPDAGAVR